jgi:hypothetical protein
MIKPSVNLQELRRRIYRKGEGLRVKSLVLNIVSSNARKRHDSTATKLNTTDNGNCPPGDDYCRGTYGTLFPSWNKSVTRRLIKKENESAFSS